MEEKKMEEIKKALLGLTSMEWGLLSGYVNYYFNQKANKLKIDDIDDLDKYIDSMLK